MVTVFGHGMVLVHDDVLSGQPSVTVHVVLSRADFDRVPGKERRIGENAIWVKRLSNEMEMATSEPPADDKVTG